MLFKSSNVRWISPERLVPCLTAALLLALCWFAPVNAHARGLVSEQGAMSAYDARHLLARLYSYSDETLALSEAEYRRLLGRRPGDPDVSLELAEVLNRLGRPAEADAIFRSLDANDPRVALGLGDALFASGRMTEAAAAYELALQAGARRADLPLRLAQSLSWSGQPEKALPYLESLHGADPANVDVTLLYVRALNQTGNRARGRAVLDTLVAAQPDNAALLFELADLESPLGHTGAVRELSLKALEIAPSSESALRAAQNMNQWGAFHRAVKLYEEQLQRSGPDRRVSLLLAEALSNSQRYEESEGILRLLLLDDPQDREARLLLATVKVREKDGEAALDVLQPLDDATDRVEADGLRAKSLELLGRYEEAASKWAQAGPEDPTRLIEQGRLLLRAGDTDAAREVFGRASQLAPQRPDVRYHIALLTPETDFPKMAHDLATSETDPAEFVRWGELFSRDARYEAAIICLETAIRLDPEFFPARMGLAENLAYSHQYDESLALLEQLGTAFPDSSKIRLTRARVLAWSRQYGSAIAAYDALHSDDLADPVPLKEMARTAFWDKRADLGRDVFDRLMEPPVDEMLAERMEAELKNHADDPALAEAAAQARQSALDGGVYAAYGRLADSPVAEAHPKLFAELGPAYRIQRAALLEQRAKLAAYNRRFSQAMDDLAVLTSVQPGNEEAWFDLGQAQCALGLCSGESATYERLLEIDPQHTLANQAIERRERRSAPWVRAGVNLWEEKGHGRVANIVRLRNDLTASLPLDCGFRIEATAHRWQEMPQAPSSQYEAFGGTLGASGVFNEWLSGSASWTAKKFTSTGPEDTDQYRARVELNLRDYARLGMAFERVDEVANRFALMSGTQSDNFILDARIPVTRRFDVEAGTRLVQYNDDNTGEEAHLVAGYALTDHPRIVKVLVRGEYRHTDKTSQEVYTAGVLTDIIHPYWTPQGYTAGSVTLEWNEDMAKEFFCGAERHYMDVKLSGGTDSDSNNAIRVEAEWVLDFNEHWGVDARGLWHRSQQWDANGLWGGVRYGF